MWDLLVLGAGPAGCAAAIEARRAGLKVAVLEATERVRPAPGETLHPGIEPIFERLGIRDAVLAARFHRHRGTWVTWNTPRKFEAFGVDESGPWLGFQANRRHLHRIMLKAALDLGVDLYRPMKADGLLVERGHVRGVLAAGHEFRACWTADGTGRRVWLARALHLARTRCSPPMFVRFGWTDEVCPDPDGQPHITATPSGWEWHAPLGRGHTAWVALRVAIRPGEEPACPGLDVSWSVHQACAGAGYFLLGDAAAVLDPSSSHGVLRATMSGMLCGHLVAAHAQRGLPESEVVAIYKGWMRSYLNHDVVLLRELYRNHPSTELAALFAASTVYAHSSDRLGR